MNLMVLLSQGYPLPISLCSKRIFWISPSLITFAIIDAADTTVLVLSQWCDEKILGFGPTANSYSMHSLYLVELTSHASTYTLIA